MRSVLGRPSYKVYSTVVQTLEGAIIGHYQIQQRLARGGMSEIYLARDIWTGKIVAIKLVHKSIHNHCERLQREIKALKALTHNNILPVLGYGMQGSWCYMAIPYIAYGTLAKRLTQGPLTEEEAGNVLRQLASALQFTHDQGMLHRDIKPSNVLLDDKQHVYLIDFGLAQLRREKSYLIQANQLFGTPDYMAPELTEGPATISSDIYALGVLLYQMLTGHAPFKAEHPMATLWKHREELPAPPSSHNPAITPAVDRVVLRALEKKPQDRFQTVNELAQAYQRASGSAETLPVAVRSTQSVQFSPISRISTYAGQNTQRMAVGLVAATLLSMVALFLGFSFSSLQAHSHYLTSSKAHVMYKTVITIPTHPSVPTLPPPTPIPTPPPAPIMVSEASHAVYQSPLLISQQAPLNQVQNSDSSKQKNSASHKNIDDNGDSRNCNSDGDSSDNSGDN